MYPDNGTDTAQFNIGAAGTTVGWGRGWGCGVGFGYDVYCCFDEYDCLVWSCLDPSSPLNSPNGSNKLPPPPNKPNVEVVSEVNRTHTKTIDRALCAFAITFLFYKLNLPMEFIFSICIYIKFDIYNISKDYQFL